MVLEIINSCLSSSLHHNPNLVYTLLYQKEMFAMFRTHPTFQDVIVNIDTVLAYFSGRLEQMGGNLSPSEVLDVIKQGSLQFRRDKLKVCWFMLFNSLPHSSDFQQPQERSLLKTSWEKEKMLVTSIFSFFYNVFYPIKDRNYHLSYIYFVVCKCFQFSYIQNCGGLVKS